MPKARYKKLYGGFFTLVQLHLIYQKVTGRVCREGGVVVTDGHRLMQMIQEEVIRQCGGSDILLDGGDSLFFCKQRAVPDEGSP